MPQRNSIPVLDAILDKRYRVLDHGFVTLTNYMGNDAEICTAARTCTSGENAKTTSDDRALIRRLMRDNHTSPFEFVEFTFLCQMPIFVARQWIRHRTANVNEMSGRFGELPELVYIPDPERISWQNPTNKQGSGSQVSKGTAQAVRLLMETGAAGAFRDYHEMLGYSHAIDTPRLSAINPEAVAELAAGGGISRELARIDLPLSTYTKWKWKIDLHNLLHFLQLRLDPHAQWEIRQYAQVMAQIVRAGVPLVWEAFEDFKLNTLTFSGPELTAIRHLTLGLEYRELGAMSKSEYAIFLYRLRDLHLDVLVERALANRSEGT